MQKPCRYVLIQTVLLGGIFLFANITLAETVYVKRSGTKMQATGSAKSKVLKKLTQGDCIRSVLQKRQILRSDRTRW